MGKLEKYIMDERTEVKYEPADGQLKADTPIVWIKRGNNIHSGARETVNGAAIFAK